MGTDTPGETGAFDVGGLEGEITGQTNGDQARAFVLAAAEGFKAEEPGLTMSVTAGAPDFDPLCAGDVDFVATVGDPNADLCGGADAVVGFHVANVDGEPLVVYVNRESLMRFEVEGLLQYCVDNADELAASANAEPLSVDELQETQTRLEQVVAGVA